MLIAQQWDLQKRSRATVHGSHRASLQCKQRTHYRYLQEEDYQ